MTWEPAKRPEATPVVVELDDDVQDARRLKDVVVDEARSLFRFVDERPSSLREHIDYAARAPWTTDITGPKRHAALLWAWAVAIPWSTVAYLSIWLIATPGRALTGFVVGLLTSTLFARIPVLAWFVPSVLDLATWWPFTLF